MLHVQRSDHGRSAESLDIVVRDSLKHRVHPMATQEQIRVYRVAEGDVADFIDDVAALRIEVFRKWPYLYEGDMAYERQYLQALVESDGAALILAEHDGQIVGASTAMPLVDEHDEFKQPFVKARLDPARVFYLAESVLRPAYRGLGIGHRFFDLREAHARKLGGTRFAMFAFCAVDRKRDDPRRPDDYRDLDPFWIKRGYTKCPELRATFDWKEIGNDQETSQTLTFWTRLII